MQVDVVVGEHEAHAFVLGQRLAEVDLATQFGVGRNSVREALQPLAADGIVDMFRHKGVVVRSLDAQETMDVRDVAQRMTGLLARSAARGIKAGKSPEEIALALEQLQSAQHDQDSEAFGRARRSFYRALLTINADDHALMRRMHKPDPKEPAEKQDKRSVISIEREDVDQWLAGTVAEASVLLHLAPVEVFDTGPSG